MKLSCSSLACIAGLMAALTSAPARAQTYTVTDLGAVTVKGMSPAGNVTGKYAGAGGNQTPFVWIPATPNGTTGVLKTLPFPKNATYGWGSSVNDRGEVTGTCAGNVGYYQATYWNASGTVRTLGILSGRGDGYGQAINASSEITGISMTSSGIFHAYLWKSGTMYDLGVGNGDAINGPGQVSGNSNGAGFLWTPTLANGTSGAGVTIPVRINYNALNDSGQAAGTDSSGPALWDPALGDVSLGSFPGYGNIFPDGLNQATSTHPLQVVGVASNSIGNRAMIWDSVNGWQDLNNLIPVGSGWVLQGAVAINDFGEIAGNGTLNGVNHAFLLAPQ